MKINVTYLKPVERWAFLVQILKNTCVRGTVWNTWMNTMENRKRGNAYAKHRNWNRNFIEHYPHDSEFV